MNGESLLIFLVIGVLAGWLAGIVVKGAGLGLIGDMVTGVIGSFIGGWLFSTLNIVHGAGFIGSLIGATVGAVILLFVLRLVRRNRAF
jgi:uncharacterized membrane protein YeaQ/YmgE (transglycosylase-associated protein family)